MSSRGAKPSSHIGTEAAARAPRDAGMEVIHTGLLQTPEQIADTVIQQDLPLLTPAVGDRTPEQSATATSLSGIVAGPLSFDPIKEARRQWDVHWGGEATPSMAAVTSLMRAQQIILARLNELLAPMDLTFPRYEALMLLLYSRRGELPLGKISDRLQVHRASVTNVVDKLVDSGYVERVVPEHDRRAVLARITKDGRRVARAATRRLNKAAFGMAPLGTEACEELYAALTPLRAAAGDFAPAGD